MTVTLLETGMIKVQFAEASTVFLLNGRILVIEKLVLPYKL